MKNIIFITQSNHNFVTVVTPTGISQVCTKCGIFGKMNSLTTIELEDGYTQEQITNCQE